jgi:hypothetical protein
MKRAVYLLALILALATSTLAQQGNAVIIRFPGAPTGSCSPITFAVNNTNGDFYDCVAGVWTKVGSISGGGFNPASPGPIGGTTPAAGTFTSVTDTGLSASLSVCTDGSKVLTTSGCGVLHTVATGTIALATSSISAGSCATVQTATATGAVSSTDNFYFNPNASIKAVTGYTPAGTLKITAYLTTDTINFDVCNQDPTNSVTPGAVTLRFTVTR